MTDPTNQNLPSKLSGIPAVLQLQPPGSYDFYTAVRTISCQINSITEVGETSHIDQDYILFRFVPEMHPTSATVTAMQVVDGSRIRIDTNIFGLLGPKGPMPEHIVELAYERSPNPKESAILNFLDIFHHRQISLLYRCWKTTSVTYSLDWRSVQSVDSQNDTISFKAIAGIADSGLQLRDNFRDQLKIYFCGLLSDRRKTVSGLRSLLSHVMGKNVFVKEFVPEWLRIETSDETKLGTNNSTLGFDTILGQRYFSIQSRFQFTTEPLEYSQYVAAMPSGYMFPIIVDAVYSYLGIEWNWSFVPVLQRDQVPDLRLNGQRRLSWDSWLTQPSRQNNPEDVSIEGSFPNEKSVRYSKSN